MIVSVHHRRVWEQRNTMQMSIIGVSIVQEIAAKRRKNWVEEQKRNQNEFQTRASASADANGTESGEMDEDEFDNLL
jgi:hypothetical protein